MVKKHKVVEYFVYLKRQIRAPIIPMIPLKIKFFDKRGLANPKTKKWEWNRFLASDVLTVMVSLMIPKLFGSSFKFPNGIWFVGVMVLSINDWLHSKGHMINVRKKRISNETKKYTKNLFLL